MPDLDRHEYRRQRVLVFESVLDLHPHVRERWPCNCNRAMLALLYLEIDGVSCCVLNLSRSVLVVFGSAFAGTLLVAVEVPSSVTSLGAVESLLYCCI